MEQPDEDEAGRLQAWGDTVKTSLAWMDMDANISGINVVSVSIIAVLEQGRASEESNLTAGEV